MDEGEVLARIEKDQAKNDLYLIIGTAIALPGLPILICVMYLIMGDDFRSASFLAYLPIFLLLAISVLLIVLGASSKPGRSIDPGLDPRPPFVASWSFSQKQLLFGEDFVHYVPTGDGGISGLPFSGRFLLKTIDSHLFKQGRMVLVGNLSLAADESMVDIVTLEETDETWFDTFVYIVKHSRGIFVIPATSAGCLQEIEALINGDLLSKTMVLMPPASSSHRHGHYDETRFESGWRYVQERLKERLKLNLPDYVADGMIYLPNPDFSIKTQYSLDNDLSQIGEIIQKALPVDDSSVLPLSMMLTHLQEIGLEAVWTNWRLKRKGG